MRPRYWLHAANLVAVAALLLFVPGVDLPTWVRGLLGAVIGTAGGWSIALELVLPRLYPPPDPRAPTYDRETDTFVINGVRFVSGIFDLWGNPDPSRIYRFYRDPLSDSVIVQDLGELSAVEHGD